MMKENIRKKFHKKMRAKRILAMFMAVLTVITLMTPLDVQAASPVPSTTTSSIESVLTHYQYFVLNDAVFRNHTVGAVVVGGNLSADNTIGDGAQAASYAYQVYNATVGNASGYGATTRDFYYMKSLSSADAMANSGFTKVDTPYIDVAGVFGTLKEQSKQLADAATQTITSADANFNNLPAIDITLEAKDTNITITYDAFKAAKAINLNIADINWLKTYKYTFNIVGVKDDTILMDGEAWMGSADSTNTDVFVNGRQYAFLGDMSGALRGIECNLSGMKLIWNFPDAEGVIKWNAMGGHVVAPSAQVKIISGRFEGGIIAAGCEATGEAHYYPYGAVTSVISDISIAKTYVDENGQAVDTSAIAGFTPAEFTLYKDAECVASIATAVVGTNGYAIFNAEANGLEKGVTYYVKETSAPGGFSINENIYVCKIENSGLISYGELGKDGVPIFSVSAPVVENMIDTTTETAGSLIVTVEDIDTPNRDKVKDVVITVVKKDDPSTPIASFDGATATNENGTITFTNLVEGEYIVKMEIPEGYVTNEEYQVEVNVQKTTYHTFELGKVKETIEVNLRDVDNKETAVTEGTFVTLEKKDEYGVYQPIETVWSGSAGKVSFTEQPSGEYRVKVSDVPEECPAGWSFAVTDPAQATTKDITITNKDTATVHTHTFYYDRETGNVEVTVVEKDNTSVTIEDATVAITYPDGTVETGTTDGTGVVKFTNVPVGEVKVELTQVPDGKDYIIPTDEEDYKGTVTVKPGETAKDTLLAEKVETVETGALKVIITTKDATTATTNGVVVRVTDPSGKVTEYPVSGNELKVNDEFTLSDVPVGKYTVQIVTVPDGYRAENSSPINVTVEKDKTAEAKYVLLVSGGIEVSVLEKGTETLVSGAEVQVVDEDGTKYPVQTTISGETIKINGLPVTSGTDNVYKVVIVPPTGYKESGTTIEIPDNKVTANTLTPVECELTPVSNIVVSVVDTDEPTIVIPGVNVKVTNGTDTYTGTTGNDGKVTFTDVPVGKYTATYEGITAGSSTANKYLATPAKGTDDTIVVTKDADGIGQLELEKASGSLTVKVVLEGTTTPFEGATVEVKDVETGNVVDTVVTDKTGQFVVTNLTVGKEYSVEVTDTNDKDYIAPTDVTKVEMKQTGTTVVKEVSKVAKATLIITIIDDATDKVINLTTGNASYKLTDPNASESIKYISTGTDSTVTLKDIDLGTYTVDYIKVPGYMLKPGEDVTQKETLAAGDTKEIEYRVIQTASIKVTVTEDGSDKPIPGAKVEVPVEGGTPITGTTNDKGEVVLEVPVKDDTTVKVTDVPNGYDVPSDKVVDVKPSVTPTEVPFVVKPNTVGKVIVTVVDEADTSVVIADVNVKVTDGTNTYTGTTGSDGKVVFTGVPYGRYTAQYESIVSGSVTADKYSDEPAVAQDTSVVVEAGKDGIGQLQLKKATEDLTVNVVIKDTTNPFAGATVVVKDSNGNIVKEVAATDATGSFVVAGLPIGEKYTVEVTNTNNPDYLRPTDVTSIVIKKDVTNSVTKEVSEVAKDTLTIKVVDVTNSTSGEIFTLPADVDFTLYDVYNDSDSTETMADGATSTMKVPSLVAGDYKVTYTNIPGYMLVPGEDVDKEVTVTIGGTNEVVYRVIQTATIKVTVKEENSGKPIPGATVEIPVEGGTPITGTTNEKGEVELTVPVKEDTTVKVTTVPGGYDKPSDVVIDVKPGTNEVPFVVLAKGQLTVVVTDKVTGAIVPNVEVFLHDGKGTSITDLNGTPLTDTTDANGVVSFKNLPDGTYEVDIKTVNDPDYIYNVVYGDDTANISGGSSVEKELKVTPIGDLVVTVINKTTNTPIANTQVTAAGPEGSYPGTTNSLGQVTFNDVPVGDYTITVDDVSGLDFYTTEDKTIAAKVEKGKVEEAVSKLVQTAGLTITVVDKTNPTTPIPGANITVTDPLGGQKDYTTDANGQVVIDKQPIGEQNVTVNTVPGGENGYILPNPNDFNITTTTDPNTNQLVVEAPKPSSDKANLTVIVRDKVTNAIVPGATVEIKDPSGNVIPNLPVTDANGQIVLKDVVTGTYEVTIKDVPSGYTKPSGKPTVITVVKGENTTQLLISGNTVSKPSPAPAPTPSTPAITTNTNIQKAPKTGDISYIPVAIGMMVISVIGMAGVIVYRKKTEE